MAIVPFEKEPCQEESLDEQPHEEQSPPALRDDVEDLRAENVRLSAKIIVLTAHVFELDEHLRRKETVDGDVAGDGSSD